MAKHRNGGLGTALVRSVMRTGAYTDLPENEPHVVGVIETVPDYHCASAPPATSGSPRRWLKCRWTPTHPSDEGWLVNRVYTTQCQ